MKKIQTITRVGSTPRSIQYHSIAVEFHSVRIRVTHPTVDALGQLAEHKLELQSHNFKIPKLDLLTSFRTISPHQQLSQLLT